MRSAPSPAAGGRPRTGSTGSTARSTGPTASPSSCDGADAVVHVAGLINAPDRAGFEAVNVAGTAGDDRRRARAPACAASSTSPRSPRASRSSPIMAGPRPGRSGWSPPPGLDWTIVRPPAVYGPGDRETFELFKMARRGLVALPPRGRFSVIHVEDLCRLILAVLDEPDTHRRDLRARRRPRERLGPPPFRAHPGPRLRQARRDRRRCRSW